MSGQLVPVPEAIKRSIHQFVSQRSTFAVHYVDPQLDAMAAQLVTDLEAFGWAITPIAVVEQFKALREIARAEPVMTKPATSQ